MVRAMSGRGSTVSKQYQPTTNEKPSETMFQRVLLDFVLKTFGLGAENETRTPASRGRLLANYIYTPNPWEGRVGSLRASHRIKQRSSPFGLLLSLSGKRDSVHLLPTLYIKQLPLPSTILPIRGTLGLFQGVVFESDFCHTNFRTTVAYDKFTNNF